jgi:hypothetical protein
MDPIALSALATVFPENRQMSLRGALRATKQSRPKGRLLVEIASLRSQ